MRNTCGGVKLQAMKGRFELVALTFFTALCGASLILPPRLSPATNAEYAQTFNAMLSVGTSGLASLLFYYLVSERLERRRRSLLRNSVQASYRVAKRNIALAMIQASRLGGRTDLTGDQATIDRALAPEGFKALFKGGQEAHEGYYAFENQMSEKTWEYDEIVFNLKVLARAVERLIDGGAVGDQASYDFFVRLRTSIARIERNGPGYDESKLLCGFLWEVFAGWNFIDGDLGYDPIQRTIDKL